MDSPMGAVRRVPKWAWVASAGVIGGVAVMRWRSNKGAQVDKAPDDGTAVGDYGLTAAPIGTGVVAAGSGGAGYLDGSGGSSTGLDYAGFLESLSDFATSVRPDAVDVVGLVDAVGSGNASIIGAIGGLPGFAGGGGAPQSSTTFDPVAPAPAAPTPPAPPPAPAATPAPDPCVGEFPNQGPGGCYKVVCATGRGEAAKGRWHYYNNGSKQHVSDTC